MFATRFVRRLVRIAGVGRAAPTPGWGWFHLALRCSLSAFHSARFALCFSLFAILLPAPASAQDCYYTWQRIQDPGGGFPSGNALNNQGMVAGTISFVGDNTRAFTWTREGGFFRLPLPPGIVSMNAHGINDLGDVVGTMQAGAPPYTSYGFIWHSASQSYTIIDLPIRSIMIYVNDINNRGEVVGSLLHRYPQQPYFWDAFVWESGEWTFLNGLSSEASSSQAIGINEASEIVGYFSDALGKSHACLVRERSTLLWLPEPSGARESNALGLNNNGVIVGQAGWSNPSHSEAIVWAPAWTLDEYPAPADSQHASLECGNEQRRAVGNYRGGIAPNRAIVAQYGTVTVLKTLVPGLPWLDGARAINDMGQIAADFNGFVYFLTPHWRPGDVTGDCHVDLHDLALVLSEFGMPVGSYPAADVNHDGQVNLEDLMTILVHFGE